jgi:L-ascorbate metabolism protein UlaG (beta-lactamase superfamily)
MTTTLTEHAFCGALADRIAVSQEQAGVRMYWLGQAGFLITISNRRVLIDPYLSDSLAEKYRGKTYPHSRMMAAPVEPTQLGKVDLVLVTHEHTDHMDPATLTPLAEKNPDCQFVVPRAAMTLASKRIGANPGNIIGLNAGEHCSPFTDCRITALRAAHEQLQLTPEGLHRFLGYVIGLGSATIYHSGDTIPFEGQEKEVAALAPQVALLPVNGRTAELTAAGISGNLTLEEARSLTGRIGASDMIAHHHGMFEFNTVSAALIDGMVSDGCVPRVHRAKTGVEYRIS